MNEEKKNELMRLREMLLLLLCKEKNFKKNF